MIQKLGRTLCWAAAGLVAFGCVAYDDTTLDTGESLQAATTVGSVTATLSTTSDWGAGFCSNVTLANVGTTVATWSLTLATNGASITQIWSANQTVSGGTVVITPASFNQTIAQGASINFGFCGAGTQRPQIVGLKVVAAGSGSSTGTSPSSTSTGTSPSSTSTGTSTGTSTSTSTSTTTGTSVPSRGCGKAAGLKSGVITLQTGGASRQYTLKVPDNYDSTKPYRVVFGFHWVGGTMADVATGQTVTRDLWSYYGLKNLADNKAILVAPQGISNGWGQGSADLTFVDDMVKQLKANLCVDESRVFAIGFSYGGAMSHALACARPGTFRAVAVQNAGAISGCAGGTQPVAYLSIHGVSDSVFSVSTGAALRDKFIKNNGCTAKAVANVSAGSRTHSCTTYQGCSAGHPVEWCSFDGGHIAAPYDGGSGDSGSKTWVPAEAWRFFSQF